MKFARSTSSSIGLNYALKQCSEMINNTYHPNSNRVFQFSNPLTRKLFQKPNLTYNDYIIAKRIYSGENLCKKPRLSVSVEVSLTIGSHLKSIFLASERVTCCMTFISFSPWKIFVLTMSNDPAKK